MPLLTDLVVIFFCSIVVLAPDGHYFDCATTAVSDTNNCLCIFLCIMYSEHVVLPLGDICEIQSTT